MTEMNPAMTDLVLEHLRAIRADIRSTHERLDTLTLRVSSLEHNVASLHGDMAAMRGDMAHMSARIDHVDRRLDRIEQRLELVDAPARTVRRAAGEPRPSSYFAANASGFSTCCGLPFANATRLSNAAAKYIS